MKELLKNKQLTNILLDSLPHPTMLIRRDKIILAANRIAREVGAKVGGYCWRDFGQSKHIPEDHKRYINQHKDQIPPGGTKCTFCLSDEAFEKNKPTCRPEIEAFGGLWEAWWVPIESNLYFHYAINISEIKRAKNKLQKAHDELERRVEERTGELKIKSENLEETNTALKVLLKQREKDRIELEEKVLSNVREMVAPFLSKLKKTRLDAGQMDYINVLESNLNDIISPFSQRLSFKHLNLTPSEIQTANLIKQGKTSKQIANMLHLSPRTIESHRRNIRDKLGIKNKKANLRTYLLSIQNT